MVFSCEICEIFKNIYFEEHLGKTASVYIKEVIAHSCPNIHDFPSETSLTESFIGKVAVKRIPSQLLYHKKFFLNFL